jgi:NAD(P)-dependent dehydrogenase (short-subunit alcohol dehydrogenase family)
MSDPKPEAGVVCGAEPSGRYRRPDRRVALVTGGGSGAGAAVARAYAALGVRVVVSDIDYTLAGAVAGEIRSGGGLALAHRCDVASQEQVTALMERAQREFGALTYLVNCAGPFLMDDPLDHWMRIVSSNLLGTMLMTHHAIQAMKERGGSIVNVASEMGLGFAAADQPAYAAAKAGIIRFTSALGFLKGEYGIRVNCIVPDWIGTEYRLAWLAELSPRMRAERAIPQTLTTPDEFAAAVVGLSLREGCSGRVLLCRCGQPLELVQQGDAGYGQLEPY